MFSDKKEFSRSKDHTWTNELARLNSSFPRIANRSLPTAPVSRLVSQLKVIQGDRNKGKTHSKIHQAAEELDYLITFNRSIT